MAHSTPRVGECHLCGTVGPLTKEHIPPQSALLSRNLRLWVYQGDAALDDHHGRGGRQYQGGFYDWVLCGRCNNLCGLEYINDFTDWSRWGIEVLTRTGGQPQL